MFRIVLSLETSAVLTSTGEARLLYSTTCIGHGRFVSGGRCLPWCSRSCSRFKRECARLRWWQCPECRRSSIRPATAGMLRQRAATRPTAAVISTIPVTGRTTAVARPATANQRPRVTDLHSRMHFPPSPVCMLKHLLHDMRPLLRWQGQLIFLPSRTALPHR